MSTSQDVVTWLEGIFAGRRRIESSELQRLASEAGINRAFLWSPEVKWLPIHKQRIGYQAWLWCAEDGWPPIREAE